MKILICDNIDELGEDFVKWAEGVLPEWRKEQMLSIKHLKGRVQCAVAYLLVEYCRDKACLVSTGRDINKSTLWRYNEHGKPYFDGRDDLFFSVSHCGGAVAVAIDDEEVGVDIEEIGRYRESLVNYVLNEDECRDKACLVRTGRDDEKAASFIEIWTKKEAVFKLLGTGITHEIKDVLVKHPEVRVYSYRIGDRFLSVATRKDIDNE